MIRFLTKAQLLFLVDFSPASFDQVSDTAVRDISDLLSVLRECPSYQIDRNHTNCGLRIRMLPILEYIEACLGQYCVGLVRQSWATDREAASWVTEAEAAGDGNNNKIFRFTREMSGDPRLRFPDAMGSAKLARTLFTSPGWDWTPDDARGISVQTSSVGMLRKALPPFSK